MNAKAWFTGQSANGRTEGGELPKPVLTERGSIVKPCGIVAPDKVYLLSSFGHHDALTCSHCCRILKFVDNGEGYVVTCCGIAHLERKAQ